MKSNVSQLKIKIFADGADIEGIKEAAANPLVKGFTTNPTLMRSAGLANCDYKQFALYVLGIAGDRPVSFEVFADDFPTMEKEAREIASWGENVYVKIPVTNTKGEMPLELIRKLSGDGVKLNITAVFTLRQARYAAAGLNDNVPAIISVFAGRIADTGRDPRLTIRNISWATEYQPNVQILWASSRELLNVFQAERARCHIITVSNDIIKKLDLVGKDLDEYSLETVRMFHRDAVAL